MKEKIAIIVDISFTKRDYERFGIKTLKKKFNVFIFDFTNTFSKSLKNFQYSKKTYKCKGYYSIKNLNILKKFVEKYKFTNCINYISNKDLDFKIINIFKKKKIPVVKIQNGLAIGPGDQRTFFQKLHILALKFTNKKRFISFLKNNFEKLKRKIYKNDGINLIFDKIVITGKKGLQDNEIDTKTKIIYAHSFDYDNYLKKNDNIKTIKKKPYAVFLDQYLPHHPDAPIFFGVDPRCTKEKYYPALNNFFNIFEKKFNMQVIICAHPKSDYKSNPNCLYGRKFVKNKTLELVKGSSLVFAHCSTTITYAVIYNKPLVFLLSDEYIRSFDNYTPFVIAKKLNSACYNIDKKNNIFNIQRKDLFKIHKKKYQIYKNEYIKYPGSSNEPFWEIFNNKINLTY